MSDLVPRPLSIGALTRHVQREMASLVADTGLAQARVQAAAEVEAARASVVAMVGQRAMTESAMLSRLERDLGDAVPEARGRLQAISDLTHMGMASVVIEASRRLGR